MSANTMDYSAKPLLLDVIRAERAKFYDLIDEPRNWNVQTRCEAWETRDIVGHMIDVTEGYLDRWQMAREGRPIDTRGLLVMAEGLDDNAKTFRRFPRDQVIARLKSDSDKMMAIFDSLTADDWNTFLVTHPYHVCRFESRGDHRILSRRAWYAARV
ncbi:MAG: maleylpyruvate isomerase N-terminal domain-containing protein [Chloroflexi bacterium]|nr:maleylpyruvate isomerase N-terminal domain-containing protein [Chloroflexota bacterium]